MKWYFLGTSLDSLPLKQPILDIVAQKLGDSFVLRTYDLGNFADFHVL